MCINSEWINNLLSQWQDLMFGYRSVIYQSMDSWGKRIPKKRMYCLKNWEFQNNFRKSCREFAMSHIIKPLKGVDGENNWGFKPLVCNAAIWMAVIEPVQQLNWIQLTVFTVCLPRHCLRFWNEKIYDGLFQHIFKWIMKIGKRKKNDKGYYYYYLYSIRMKTKLT